MLFFHQLRLPRRQGSTWATSSCFWVSDPRRAEMTRHSAFANTAASRLFKGIFSWLLHSSLHPTPLVTVSPRRKWEKRIEDKGRNIQSTLWRSFSEKYSAAWGTQERSDLRWSECCVQICLPSSSLCRWRVTATPPHTHDCMIKTNLHSACYTATISNAGSKQTHSGKVPLP